MKEAVQEFADHILQVSDSPNDNKSTSSSSSSPGRDRGHSSPFFSSMGHRSPRGGFGFRSSDNDEENDDSYRHHNHSSEGNVSSFRRGGDSQFRGAYVEEPLVPALFYITVAGLTGSILARRSKFFSLYHVIRAHHFAVCFTLLTQKKKSLTVCIFTFVNSTQ